ncbi:hypothetical protein BIW11_05139 [Tropilaelaps mercedesae]|uniref:Uncharacterized protein n=1 Tax=Tropilaelaps mercedesae TaxID=418985 RepID=A0A1V9Y3Q8_9ACAR|nr:hypothetical protein BIW11_05139 [Tropilaelaps mercedesae]
MSNNNEANLEANENNNEVDQRENVDIRVQRQHHNHNNIPQPQQGHGHALDHDPLNNQNNPPEWAAFPDLLRVQEPQQNGSGAVIVAGDGIVGGAGVPLGLQRAGVANPPDVSLPGAAGRDPPPPDFDIDRIGALHNQRLPDMALDADQAQGQAVAAAQHSLPDMALEASGVGAHARAPAGQCSGARLRPRRSPGPPETRMGPRGIPVALSLQNQQHHPGSLARMAQAAAIGGGAQPVDNNRVVVRPPLVANHEFAVDAVTGRLVDLEAQVAGLRQQMLERDRHRAEESARVLDELASLRRSIDAFALAGRDRDQASLENRLINIESLIQRLAQGPSVAVRAQQPPVIPDDVLASLRAEERRRQRRETERLTRILAESLHVAVEHFIGMLNQDHREDDRLHEDHAR